jgi:hypothetical protein
MKPFESDNSEYNKGKFIVRWVYSLQPLPKGHNKEQ